MQQVLSRRLGLALLTSVVAVASLATPSGALAMPADVVITNTEDAPVPTRIIGTPDVRVSNLSKDPVQATLVGAPEVQVEGTPEVRIVDAVSPLPVQPAIPIPETITIPLEVRAMSSASGLVRWSPPAGKRFVITAISSTGMGDGAPVTGRATVTVLTDSQVVRRFSMERSNQGVSQEFHWNVNSPLSDTVDEHVYAGVRTNYFVSSPRNFPVYLTGFMVDA